MHQNAYLKKHMKEMKELAAKPQPKRSQAEAYAQYDRFEQLFRENAAKNSEGFYENSKSREAGVDSKDD